MPKQIKLNGSKEVVAEYAVKDSHGTDIDINDLQTRISHLEGIGRFLSTWNASTGKATTNPPVSPYQYKTGDYFRIATAGNKIPNGSSYVIGGTNYVEREETYVVGNYFYFDGTHWQYQTAPSQQSGIVDVQVSGESVVAAGIANIEGIAPLYSNEETYNAGDLVYHDGILYKALFSITTPENWSSAKWIQTDLATEMQHDQETATIAKSKCRTVSISINDTMSMADLQNYSIPGVLITNFRMVCRAEQSGSLPSADMYIDVTTQIRNGSFLNLGTAAWVNKNASFNTQNDVQFNDSKQNFIIAINPGSGTVDIYLMNYWLTGLLEGFTRTYTSVFNTNDIILLKEANLPERWLTLQRQSMLSSALTVNAYAIESKIPTNMLNTDGVQTISANKTIQDASFTFQETVQDTADFYKTKVYGEGIYFETNKSTGQHHGAIDLDASDGKIVISTYNNLDVQQLFTFHIDGTFGAQNLRAFKIYSPYNDTYGINVPNMTGATADKTMATTDQIPHLYQHNIYIVKSGSFGVYITYLTQYSDPFEDFDEFFDSAFVTSIRKSCTGVISSSFAHSYEFSYPTSTKTISVYGEGTSDTATAAQIDTFSDDVEGLF